MDNSPKSLYAAMQTLSEKMELDNTRVRMWRHDPHMPYGALDENLKPIPYVSLEQQVEKSTLGLRHKSYEPLISATLVNNDGKNELQVQHCDDCYKEVFSDFLQGYAINQGIDSIVWH